MTVTENPFLAGNYGPVSDERTETDLAVEGAVPTELRGRYLRIGPNPLSPPDGPYHWFAYWFAEPYLVYYVIDASGALVRSEPITIPRAVMMHDFAISREHVLFFDLPVVFDLDVQPFPFRWDDDTPARIGVMPRGGG